MSIRVNGKKIPLYQNDDKSKILVRIAIKFETLPRYILMEEKIEEIKNGEEYKIRDLLEEIRKKEDETDFFRFVKENEELIEKIKINKKEIFKLWLINNKSLKEIYKHTNVILEENEIEKLLENKYIEEEGDVEEIFDHQDKYLNEIKIEKENLKIREERFREIKEKLENVKQEKYSEFIIEKLGIKYEIDIENVTLLEIFNEIITNEMVPFATCQNYYKIHKDFIPPKQEEEKNYDWNVSLDNFIIMKVVATETKDEVIGKKYANVYITIEEEKVYILTKINVEKIYATKKEMIKRIGSVFQKKIQIKGEIKEEEIIGTYFYPKLYINTYVLSDMIMNDQIFSAYLNTLEFNKVSKKKDATGQTWLSLWFIDETNTVSFSIGRKTIDRREYYIKTTDPEKFPHGEPMLRVHVKGENMKIIDNFREILSKLLRIYREKEKEIISEYKKILPEFGERIIENIPKLKKEEMSRQLFVSNYSRSCPKVPKEISREKAEKYIKNKTKDVLIFPRIYPGEGPKYPSDASDQKNQKYYICDHEKAPYPGVKLNKALENKEEYPYIPCCYENPQSYFETKDGKTRIRTQNYDYYYDGILPEKKEMKQQKLIKTKKILKKDAIGLLSEKIQKFFETINDRPSKKFIRYGVDRNPSCFLSCIEIALGGLDGNIDERTTKLYELRTILSKQKNAILTKQSEYQISISELSKKILDFDVYLDPKYFLQLLEEYYDCNIYIFNDNGMVLPNSIEGLYRRKKDGKTILIYEHMGAEFDALTYPQCELIARYDPEENTNFELNFSKKSEISNKIEFTYMMMNSNFINNSKFDNIQDDLPIDIIVSQVVDAFGKCRCININVDDLEFSVFLSPTQPINIRPISKENIKFINIDDLDKIKNILRNRNFIFIDNFSGKIGDIDFTLKLFDDNYETLEKSKIDIYNYNKKIARYLIQYTYWNFSNFYSNDNSRDIINSLNFFESNFFEIRKNHIYKNIPKIFSINNDIITSNKKIIVLNSKTIKRLIYSLKLALSQREKEILNFKNRFSMENFYQDITDFDIYSKQILLFGEDSVDKWIQDNLIKNNLFNKIIDSNQPYFFMNSLISDKVFIAQNTNSLAKALDIANIWNIYGYNIFNSAVNTIQNFEFNLFVYSNSNDIEKIKVLGNKSPKPINIIGYKIDNNDAYTVLLN